VVVVVVLPTRFFFSIKKGTKYSLKLETPRP